MKGKIVKNGFRKKLFSLVFLLAMVFIVLPLNKMVANAVGAPTPLTFTALEDNSSVTLKWISATSVEYSTDDGNTWSTYAPSTTITLPNAGDKVLFRGNNIKTDTTNHFSMTGKISASGDVTSLTNGSGGDVALTADCYRGMFYRCTSLVNAAALPSTNLADRCYKSMFIGCTGLINAPALPATTLAEECYSIMFEDCTGLINAPALPATTLAQFCYEHMFNGCTNLTGAPELPATTLEYRCYISMFRDCTSLINAPVLRATSLAGSCYTSMFEGCTSLLNAPALPATTLEYNCYSRMFQGCTSLLRAPALPATTLKNGCYESMFEGCTSLSSVPELKITSLGNFCFEEMFYGCTNLIVTETTNASEATWIFPATAAAYWSDNMIAGLTAPGTLTAVDVGKMYKVSYVVPLPTPPAPPTTPAASGNVYEKTIVDAVNQMEFVSELLANGYNVPDSTVYFTGGEALPITIMVTLKKCPGVTLDFQCTYEGEMFHFRLKGGDQLVVNEDIYWYGPLYLKSIYGVVGEEKDAAESFVKGTYITKRGDTMYFIARNLGITLADLIRENPQIENPDHIWAGQTLKY